MPAALCLLDRVRAATVGVAREFWPRAVGEAVLAGALPFEAYTTLQEMQAPAPCGSPPQTRLRLPPRTRQDRWDERPETPSGRFIRPMSLDPVLDWSLSDGAVRCLHLVMSLAGGTGRAFATLTSSIAKQLGRTARTVQNYWRELADSGLLEHNFNRKTGLVTIIVTKAAEPPPLPEKPKPWPRMPRPKAGWKRVARGGAKLASHIKAKVCESPLLAESVLAAEAHFRPG
jgi:Helix-turn-helix domain